MAAAEGRADKQQIADRDIGGSALGKRAAAHPTAIKRHILRRAQTKSINGRNANGFVNPDQKNTQERGAKPITKTHGIHVSA